MRRAEVHETLGQHIYVVINTLYYRDVFKADGEFEKFGRGGGVIRGEGEVFREHDSSSTSHQEQDFNRGGFFGPSGGSESDSSFQNRLVVRMHFTIIEKEITVCINAPNIHIFWMRILFEKPI